MLLCWQNHLGAQIPSEEGGLCWINPTCPLVVQKTEGILHQITNPFLMPQSQHSAIYGRGMSSFCLRSVFGESPIFTPKKW